MNAIVRQARSGAASLVRIVGNAQRRVAESTTDAFAADALPFLDPVDQITEASPPRFMRSILYVIGGMLVSGIAIATIVKIDMVVIGRGELSTEQSPMVLQPFDRAIIRDIDVKPGDVVKKGQLLATLDPTFAHADLSALTSQQRALKARLERLEAELNEKPFVLGPAATPEERLQETLYREQQNQFKSKTSAMDEEIGSLIASVRSAEDDRASLEKELTVAKEVESMRSALLQSQNGSKLSYLDAQTLRMRTERNLQGAANRLQELQHTIQAKKADRQAYTDAWRRELTEDLVAAQTEAAQIAQGMSKAALVDNLVVVTAPEDGVVLDVARKSVGSVMNAAEQLVTIAPSESRLVAEITISSADIGYVRADEDVVVKVDAFPYQRHGYLHGKLKFVSEESYRGGDSEAGAVHRGRVEFESTELKNLPTGGHLIPGMTLSAEIKVGARRAITFFIYPLIKGLGESLREP